MSRPELSVPGEVRTLRIIDLRPSPANPRKRFEGLDELADSIRAHGVLSPLLVRERQDRVKYFEIVAGERRFRAAQLAGLTEVPVIVRELDDREAAELAVLENIQRDALTPLEEADGFRTLVETHGMAVAAVAERVGRSRAYVGNRLAIAHAGEAVRTALADGRIGASVALVLARLPEAAQAEALARCGERPTVDDAIHAADAAARLLADAPFGIDDASLSPADGACSDCPRRTGAERGLFGADGDDLCLDAACWRRKCGVAFVQRAATHPGPVMNADAAAEHFGQHGIRWDSPYMHKPPAAEVAKLPPKLATKAAALKVTLAQDPDTGAAVELVNKKAWSDLVSASKPAAKPAAAPKVTEAQRAAEAERKRCEAAGAALIAAAVADRKNAAARLIGLGRSSYGDEFQPMALAVAGATKQTALAAWARKCSKDDFAAFVLADRLEGEYCGGAESVRSLAARLDLPVPAGFAEAPKPRGKRGAK